MISYRPTIPNFTKIQQKIYLLIIYKTDGRKARGETERQKERRRDRRRERETGETAGQTGILFT
jgi:hypothetical protein